MPLRNRGQEKPLSKEQSMKDAGCGFAGAAPRNCRRAAAHLAFSAQLREVEVPGFVRGEVRYHHRRWCRRKLRDDSIILGGTPHCLWHANPHQVGWPPVCGAVIRRAALPRYFFRPRNLQLLHEC